MVLVTFTAHAKDQMKYRDISEREVKEVLSKPSETIVTRGKRLPSFVQIRDIYVVVIYEKTSNGYEEELVITAMKVDRRRLLRFGFSNL